MDCARCPEHFCCKRSVPAFKGSDAWPLKPLLLLSFSSFSVCHFCRQQRSAPAFKGTAASPLLGFSNLSFAAPVLNFKVRNHNFKDPGPKTSMQVFSTVTAQSTICAGTSSHRPFFVIRGGSQSDVLVHSIKQTRYSAFQ